MPTQIKLFDLKLACVRLRATITLHNVAKDFINSYLNSIPTISQDLTCFFHYFKDRRYKEYLVKLSDRISKMQQQKSLKLIVQEQQLRSRRGMAIRVVEFSNEWYKIRKVLA